MKYTNKYSVFIQIILKLIVKEIVEGTQNNKFQQTELVLINLYIYRTKHSNAYVY